MASDKGQSLVSPRSPPSICCRLPTRLPAQDSDNMRELSPQKSTARRTRQDGNKKRSDEKIVTSHLEKAKSCDSP